jgi:hypothetical protein
MTYQAVTIYDANATFLGYAIKQDGVDKLHNTNLWTQNDIEDLKKQLHRLNDQTSVLQFWPDVRDPEVKAITDDPNFEPLKLSPVEVIDEENSVYVWIEEPSEENPFGEMDRELSHIAYKHEMAPAPTDVQARIKKACEIVARRRAEAHG